MILPFLVIAQSQQNNIQSILTDLNGSFSVSIEENQFNAITILREFNSLVNLSEDHTFEKYYEEDDNLGFTHIKYKQVYKGIPIDGGILMVHIKNNIVSSINGRVLRFDDIDLSVNISKENALEIAKLDLKVTNLTQEYPVETLIRSKNNKGENEVQLVHKVKIISFTPMLAFDVFIDAKTGRIVSKISLSCNTAGTIHTHYNGLQNITCHPLNLGNYVLEDYTRNIGTYNATFSTGTSGGGGPLSAQHISSPTSNFIPDPNNGVTVMAGDVHWGMAKTYDFFLNTFGRNSYDNQGGTIFQYINPPNLNWALGANPNNAYAVSDGIIGGVSYMAYGLGDGNTMDYVASLDVLAHEFTHNVTAFTSQLIYEEENGALNESFSDILGYAIKNATTGSNTWTIGEELYQNILNPPSPPIMRSMSNPHAKGDPDTYQASTDWLEIIPPFDDNNDYGGVHINSGVQNHWFYLLSQGGSGVNDNGDSYSVSGIGINQALEIAYRNLTTYLTPSSIFTDAYNGSLQSAADLYGNSSSQYSAVQDAWAAVGVGIYCDGTTNLTSASGSFDDGSGNANYNRYSDCKWLIDVPGATSIDLSFSAFDTEFGYDGIIVYDGNSINATALDTFSGQSIPPSITSSGSQLLVRFISDAYITSSGWSANYTANTNTISGCTDASAYNYNSNATIDDGSCCYIAGCMDQAATNYNSSACFDDGSCNYPGQYTDAIISNVTFGSVGCGGHPTQPSLDYTPWYIISYTLSNAGNVPITDFTIFHPGNGGGSPFSTTPGVNTLFPILPGDSLMKTYKVYRWSGWTNSAYDMEINGVNNETNTNNNIVTVYLPTMPICDTIYGCTDITACNYDSNANLDDGSCYYGVLGCTDATACNYEATATCDDGSCYNLISSINQSGETLFAVTTPIGLNADWYNIQIEDSTSRIWLMEEDAPSFTPTFDCSYFIIVEDGNCSVTSETYYYGENAARIGSFITSPNPTSGLINVKFDNPKSQFVMFELISNNGTKLDEFITIADNLDINLSKYPSGTYYLYFDSEDATQGCRLEEVQKVSTKIILNK
jgi:Zn-dependent metalloprotease